MEAINISSNSLSLLGAALSNNTVAAKQNGKIAGDYSVKFQGNTFADAMSAYVCLSDEDEINKELMVSIIAAKLWQNKILIKAINKQFKEQASTDFVKETFDWLKTCNHRGEGFHNKKWEGTGTESLFIYCLCRAYMRVTDEYLRTKWGVD